MEHDTSGTWSAPWAVAVTVLGSVAAVIAQRAGLAPFTPLLIPVVALFGLAVALVGTLIQHAEHGGGHGWVRVYVFRVMLALAAGSWSTWAVLAGWQEPVSVSLGCGALGLFALAHLCRTPQRLRREVVQQDEGPDRRPKVIRVWEARIRQITKQKVTVTSVEPWSNPEDGMRLLVELPADTGMTTADLAAFTDRLQHAARLPQGCAVRVLESNRQGTAVLDVMLRDCLCDEVTIDEGTTAASINDEFTVMTSPRGERLNICLRIFSMIVGGTVGSGKTTLLHRIIMRLARCVDALIWVVDTNGGGVAESWISPWARGEASRPVVDWVADNEDEAAVLVSVAAAIAKDRKTNMEATRRKKAANADVLPVDTKMPAIIVLTDEGGEVRQARSLLGQIAAEGITRLAQIGRAEGVRVIMSVLRGTADLLDKGLRTNAAIRLCLRMEEEGEYDHVLGANPGRTRLLHTGSAYLRRQLDPKPIFGRTVNVPRDARERHAIACADLRPELDERGQQVAAKVRPRDVTGKDPAPEIAALPVMQDVAGGRAYSGRWERYAAKLAEMRGEELPDIEPGDQEPQAPAESSPPPATSGTGALDAWAAAVNGPAPAPAVQRSSVDLNDQAAVDAEARRLLGALEEPDTSPPPGSAGTARERILAMVDEAGPEGISAGDIEKSAGVARSRSQQILKELREEGLIRYREPGQQGVYVTPRHARSA